MEFPNRLRQNTGEDPPLENLKRTGSVHLMKCLFSHVDLFFEDWQPERLMIEMVSVSYLGVRFVLGGPIPARRLPIAANHRRQFKRAYLGTSNSGILRFRSPVVSRAHVY
jgi:hypothetical protein